MKLRHWVIAAITVVVLFLVTYIHEIISRIPAYRSLHSHRPFYVAESFDQVGGALICLLAIWLMRRSGGRDIARSVAMSAPIIPAFVFALISSLPMLIGFAMTRGLTSRIEVLPLLFVTIVSPLVEEIEFRGFGFFHLQLRTGWPFWLAVWPSALSFGWGHVDSGQSWGETLGLFLLTTAGGVAFAWLVYRWKNLWFAVALHIFMNLWWELFSVARTAIGGWFPFLLQSLTIVLAVLITLYWTRGGGGISPKKELSPVII